MDSGDNVQLSDSTVLESVFDVVRGSSVVQCWTRNRVCEPGFESPFATVSKIGHFHSLH